MNITKCLQLCQSICDEEFPLLNKLFCTIQKDRLQIEIVSGMDVICRISYVLTFYEATESKKIIEDRCRQACIAIDRKVI